MKVKFNGPEPEVTVFGRTFVAGEPTDVRDLPAEQRGKLANNPTFTELKPVRRSAR